MQCPFNVLWDSRCGIGLLGILATSHYVPWLSAVLVLVCKLCISGAFSLIYIHSGEIFPTPIRNTGMGLVSVASRLGGIVCPYLAALGSVVPNLHFVLFGLLATVSGVMNLRLPETTGRPMPEMMADLLAMLDDAEGRAIPKSSNLVGSAKYELLKLDSDSDFDDRDQQSV